MLDALVASVAGLLIVAGVIVIVGPRSVARSLRSAVRRPGRVPAVFETKRPREVSAQTLNPKTQRIERKHLPMLVYRDSARDAGKANGRSEEFTSLLQAPSRRKSWDETRKSLPDSELVLNVIKSAPRSRLSVDGRRILCISTRLC